jgi:hypothetical protein
VEKYLGKWSISGEILMEIEYKQGSFERNGVQAEKF